MLCKLPRRSVVLDDSFRSRQASEVVNAVNPVKVVETASTMDWGSSLIGGGQDEIKEESLELKWSDDENDEEKEKDSKSRLVNGLSNGVSLESQHSSALQVSNNVFNGFV